MLTAPRALPLMLRGVPEAAPGAAGAAVGVAAREGVVGRGLWTVAVAELMLVYRPPENPCFYRGWSTFLQVGEQQGAPPGARSFLPFREPPGALIGDLLR